LRSGIGGDTVYSPILKNIFQITDLEFSKEMVKLLNVVIISKKRSLNALILQMFILNPKLLE
jgi:hypothetical protein